MKPSARRLRRWAPAAVLLSMVACSGSVAPDQHPLEIVAVSGDGIFVVPGTRATFVAQVRARHTGLAREGVHTTWMVESGDARLVGSATAVSDALGRVGVDVELGPEAGRVILRAELADDPSETVRFTAEVADRPELTEVVPASAPAGSTVSLSGSAFSAGPAANVVLFSGIRGRVVSAAPDRLDVEVPPCLPSREVAVSVQIGDLTSDGRAFQVTGGGHARDLAPWQILDDARPADPGCLRLVGRGRYLVMVGSVAGAEGAGTTYGIRALGETPLVSSAALPRRLDLTVGRAVKDRPVLEARLRREEQVAVAAWKPGASTPSVGNSSPPVVGELREFKVRNALGGFDDVTAVARFVGRTVAIYLDRDAPQPGFTEAELSAVGREFDEIVEPTVTDAFGPAPDLDANGRVVVLFTPAVNRLTPAGNDGFIGGFFYGVDLLPGSGGSNGGEVLYAVVPDPTGRYADPRSKSRVLDAVPAILAHEFQHMVHFNQRVLLRDGEGLDALWLSEGMAQMAEELVARTAEASERGERAALFRAGNRERARRFLLDPGGVSLLVGQGQGSLAERGAGWLFVLFLADRYGVDVLGRLAATTRVGIENVRSVVGGSWSDTLFDWWTALYLEAVDGAPHGLGYEGLDLAALADGLPPVATEVGPYDVTRDGALGPSAVAYYLVRPAADGSMTLRVSGESGGPPDPGSDLRVRVVRIH